MENKKRVSRLFVLGSIVFLAALAWLLWPSSEGAVCAQFSPDEAHSCLLNESWSKPIIADRPTAKDQYTFCVTSPHGDDYEADKLAPNAFSLRSKSGPLTIQYKMLPGMVKCPDHFEPNDARRGILTMPANGDSPHIMSGPGETVSFTGDKFSTHIHYTDGHECRMDSTTAACPAGPQLYEYVHDESGRQNSVSYVIRKP